MVTLTYKGEERAVLLDVAAGIRMEEMGTGIFKLASKIEAAPDGEIPITVADLNTIFKATSGLSLQELLDDGHDFMDLCNLSADIIKESSFFKGLLEKTQLSGSLSRRTRKKT